MTFITEFGVIYMTKRKIIITTAILLCVFTLFAPRFLFREARISDAIDMMMRGTNRELDVSLNDMIVDYRGRWGNMYAKFELTAEGYEVLKNEFLMSGATVSNNDFADEVLYEYSRYQYDPAGFSTTLSYINSAIRMRNLNTMSLEDIEELLIQEHFYGRWFTGAVAIYAIVKETSGNFYMYIIKG